MPKAKATAQTAKKKPKEKKILTEEELLERRQKRLAQLAKARQIKAEKKAAEKKAEKKLEKEELLEEIEINQSPPVPNKYATFRKSTVPVQSNYA